MSLNSPTDAHERLSPERQQSFIDALLENVEDAIVACDANGTLTAFNHAARRLHGMAELPVEPDEWADYYDLYLPDGRTRMRKEEIPLYRAWQGERVRDVEIVIAPRGAAPRTVLASGAAIYGRDGEKLGAVVVLRDFTERKEAQEARLELAREQAARAEAEAANRLKDEFLATLSHELRTPLTAILGWAKMLADGQVSEEKTADAFGAIYRNARTQAQLIDDLLDVSRVITGKLRIEVVPVNLGAVVTAAAAIVRPAATAKGVTLNVSLDGEALMVNGDPARLQQVVWNLLSNAVKFTPAGGEVAARVGRAGSQLEVMVGDTGQGIDPEFLPHVFERFRQGESGTARRHSGLGLGLAIVRHLVELHGGIVMAESEGEGRGSTFTVRLPVRAVRATEPGPTRAEERARLVGASAAPTTSLTLEGVKVLLADDEPDARRLLKEVLARRGAEVLTAESASEALEMLQAWRPHVLLFDIGMPSGDGYELIQMVRELSEEQGGRTPAAALTAYAGPADRARALASGFQLHIAKPVEPAELLMVVARLAGRGI